MSADRVISTVLLVALGLLVLGWLVGQAVGEFRLRREYARPRPTAPTRESCLRRADSSETITALREACADLDAARRRLADVNDEAAEVTL